MPMTIAPAPDPTPAPQRGAPDARPPLHEVLPPDCVELHALGLHAARPDANGKPPAWVHISPAGEVDEETGERVVRGRDGRRFAVLDAAAVLEATELPMQFDWEHLSMYPAAWGGSTRAAGWIDRIEFLEKGDTERPAPGFWAHVERWTPDGQRDVADAYFRGLSPVVRWQRREPEVEGDDPPPPILVGFVNVALTNMPNLRMTLLHREEHTSHARPASSPTPAGPPPRLSPEAAATFNELATLRIIAPESSLHWYRACATPGGLRGARELIESYRSRRRSGGAGGPVTPSPAHDEEPRDAHGLTELQAHVADGMGLAREEYSAALRDDGARFTEAERIDRDEERPSRLSDNQIRSLVANRAAWAGDEAGAARAMTAPLSELEAELPDELREMQRRANAGPSPRVTALTPSQMTVADGLGVSHSEYLEALNEA